MRLLAMHFYLSTSDGDYRRCGLIRRLRPRRRLLPPLRATVSCCAWLGLK
ncbi:MAG: hypothetical protein NZL98_04140 [Anaerolineales bacterium]|nr:hypothetical protein [Anaerolineales bacterium]